MALRNYLSPLLKRPKLILHELALEKTFFVCKIINCNVMKRCVVSRIKIAGNMKYFLSLNTYRAALPLTIK